jgi:hypothetical protein
VAASFAELRSSDKAAASAVAAAMAADGDRLVPRLNRGCRCFAAWSEGQVRAYGWLSLASEWIGEIEREIVPSADEAYAWNCVTMKGHLGRGLFRAIVASTAEAARDAGRRRLWIGSVGRGRHVALTEIGFRPALRFWVLPLPEVRLVHVVAGADSATLEAAPRALGLRRPPLWLLQRARRRWH